MVRPSGGGPCERDDEEVGAWGDDGGAVERWAERALTAPPRAPERGAEGPLRDEPVPLVEASLSSSSSS
jgi:hypothetical protein